MLSRLFGVEMWPSQTPKRRFMLLLQNTYISTKQFAFRLIVSKEGSSPEGGIRIQFPVLVSVTPWGTAKTEALTSKNLILCMPQTKRRCWIERR